MGLHCARMVKILVYSDQFWPAVVHPAEEKESKLILPAIIQSEIDEMKKNFSAYRPGRSLSIKNQVGMVTLAITIGERVHDLSVTPLQAAIVNQFEKSDSLSLEEIASHVGLEESTVAKRISFWVSKGILIQESETVYRCVGENEEVISQGADMNAETAEQLEQERAEAELEARYKVKYK